MYDKESVICDIYGGAGDSICGGAGAWDISIQADKALYLERERRIHRV